MLFDITGLKISPLSSQGICKCSEVSFILYCNILHITTNVVILSRHAQIKFYIVTQHILATKLLTPHNILHNALFNKITI